MITNDGGRLAFREHDFGGAIGTQLMITSRCGSALARGSRLGGNRGTGPADQSSTWPRMQVTVPPATQMAPSASREMWTRPARPRAVPWLTT